MTLELEKSKQPAWDIGSVIEWLLDHGRFLPDVDTLVGELAEVFLRAGAPIC